MKQRSLILFSYAILDGSGKCSRGCSRCHDEWNVHCRYRFVHLNLVRLSNSPMIQELNSMLIQANNLTNDRLQYGPSTQGTPPAGRSSSSTNVNEVNVDSERQVDIESGQLPNPSTLRQAWSKYRITLGWIVFIIVHIFYAWLTLHNSSSSIMHSGFIGFGRCDGTMAGEGSKLGWIKFNQTIG